MFNNYLRLFRRVIYYSKIIVNIKVHLNTQFSVHKTNFPNDEFSKGATKYFLRFLISGLTICQTQRTTTTNFPNEKHTRSLER